MHTHIYMNAQFTSPQLKSHTQTNTIIINTILLPINLFLRYYFSLKLKKPEALTNMQ